MRLVFYKLAILLASISLTCQQREPYGQYQESDDQDGHLMHPMPSEEYGDCQPEDTLEEGHYGLSALGSQRSKAQDALSSSMKDTWHDQLKGHPRYDSIYPRRNLDDAPMLKDPDKYYSPSRIPNPLNIIRSIYDAPASLDHPYLSAKKSGQPTQIHGVSALCPHGPLDEMSNADSSPPIDTKAAYMGKMTPAAAEPASDCPGLAHSLPSFKSPGQQLPTSGQKYAGSVSSPHPMDGSISAMPKKCSVKIIPTIFSVDVNGNNKPIPCHESIDTECPSQSALSAAPWPPSAILSLAKNPPTMVRNGVTVPSSAWHSVVKEAGGTHDESQSFKLSFRKLSKVEICKCKKQKRIYQAIANDNASKGHSTYLTEERMNAIKLSFGKSFYAPKIKKNGNMMMIDGSLKALVNMQHHWILFNSKLRNYEPDLEYSNGPSNELIVKLSEKDACKDGCLVKDADNEGTVHRFLFRFDREQGYENLFQSSKTFTLNIVPSEDSTARLVIRKKSVNGPLKLYIYRDRRMDVLDEDSIYIHKERLELQARLKDRNELSVMELSENAVKLLYYIKSMGWFGHLNIKFSRKEQQQIQSSPKEWHVLQRPGGPWSLSSRVLSPSEIANDIDGRELNMINQGGELECIVNQGAFSAFVLTMGTFQSISKAFLAGIECKPVNSADQNIIFDLEAKIVITHDAVLSFKDTPLELIPGSKEFMLVVNGRRYYLDKADPMDIFNSIDTCRFHLPCTFSSGLSAFITVQKIASSDGPKIIFYGGPKIFIDGMSSNFLSHVVLDPQSNTLGSRYLHHLSKGFYCHLEPYSGHLLLTLYKQGLLNIMVRGAGSQPTDWTALERATPSGVIKLQYRERTPAEIRDTLTRTSMDGRMGSGEGEIEVVINNNPKIATFVSKRLFNEKIKTSFPVISYLRNFDDPTRQGCLSHYWVKFCVTQKELIAKGMAFEFHGNSQQIISRVDTSCSGTTNRYIWHCSPPYSGYVQLFDQCQDRTELALAHGSSTGFKCVIDAASGIHWYGGAVPLLFNGVEVDEMRELELDVENNIIYAKYKIKAAAHLPSNYNDLKMAQWTVSKETADLLRELNARNKINIAIRHPFSPRSPKSAWSHHTVPGNPPISLSWRKLSPEELSNPYRHDIDGRSLLSAYAVQPVRPSGPVLFELVINHATKTAYYINPTQLNTIVDRCHDTPYYLSTIQESPNEILYYNHKYKFLLSPTFIHFISRDTPLQYHFDASFNHVDLLWDGETYRWAFKEFYESGGQLVCSDRSFMSGDDVAGAFYYELFSPKAKDPIQLDLAPPSNEANFLRIKKPCTCSHATPSILFFNGGGAEKSNVPLIDVELAKGTQTLKARYENDLYAEIVIIHLSVEASNLLGSFINKFHFPIALI